MVDGVINPASINACAPTAPSLSVTVSETVYVPMVKNDDVPLTDAPEASRVDGVVVPMPQSRTAGHGESEPGSTAAEAVRGVQVYG